MDHRLRQRVRERAGNRCEYCRLRQEHEPLTPFHVEHIVAGQHEGTDDFENLALACAWCNLVKGPNIAALDPMTRVLTRLFHPRHDCWSDHFRRDGPLIAGLSDVGRATVKLLRMNDPDSVDQRTLLLLIGDLD